MKENTTTQATNLQAMLATAKAQADYDEKHFIKSTLSNTSGAIIETAKVAKNIMKTVNLAVATNYVDELRDIDQNDLAVIAELL